MVQDSGTVYDLTTTENTNLIERTCPYPEAYAQPNRRADAIDVKVTAYLRN